MVTSSARMHVAMVWQLNILGSKFGGWYTSATMATTWTSFGPDPAISDLSEEVQACLQQPAGSESNSCDGIIGSASTGRGFCADEKYKQTTYCACVNNAISCPQVAMASCANAAFAYKPSVWYQRTGTNGPTPNETCSKSTICVNLIEVGGSHNIVTGANQQCGTFKTFVNVLKVNPQLAAITFMLFITLIAIMSLQADSDGDNGTKKRLLMPPRPPSGMFGISTESPFTY
jgi:hypothetical protein